MRHIPARILRRNRQNSYAEEQAQGYRERPRKTGGPCQLCAKPEDDHDLGLCDDLRTYVPPVEKCVVKECRNIGAVRDRYYVCAEHLALVEADLRARMAG